MSERVTLSPRNCGGGIARAPAGAPGGARLFTIAGTHQQMLRNPQAGAVAGRLSALMCEIDEA